MAEHFGGAAGQGRRPVQRAHIRAGKTARMEEEVEGEVVPISPYADLRVIREVRPKAIRVAVVCARRVRGLGNGNALIIRRSSRDREMRKDPALRLFGGKYDW